LSAPGPQAEGGDPLAPLLLPVLVHRLNNATQLLSNLDAVLRVGGERDWLAERSSDLGDSAHDVHELGYVLAVLASASGADLLLARREPAGLAYMLRVVASCAAREGRGFELPGELPELAPEVHAGWELAWAAAALLCLATLALPEGEGLDWSIAEEGSGWALRCSGEFPAACSELRPRLAERLPGSRIAVGEGEWSWWIPGDWLLRPSERARA